MNKLIFAFALLCSSGLAAKDSVYELTTAVSGVVQKIEVAPGDKVSQGQVLLVLDQRVFKAEHEVAEKTVKSAELSLAEAKKELERTTELYDRTVISDHELELARVAFAKAEKNHAMAKKQLVYTQSQLDYSQIIAPVSGKIISIKAWVGMVVNNRLENTVLITLEE